MKVALCLTGSCFHENTDYKNKIKNNFQILKNKNKIKIIFRVSIKQKEIKNNFRVAPRIHFTDIQKIKRNKREYHRGALPLPPAPSARPQNFQSILNQFRQEMPQNKLV